MNVKDKDLLKGACDAFEKEEFANCSFEHPGDKEVLGELNKLLDLLNRSKDVDLYTLSEDIEILWSDLVSKAVKCLRYFDEREPYAGKNKVPMAYGAPELSDYFRKYTKFEKTLYGTIPRYRDHVIHVFRTWILGVKLLTDENLGSSRLLDQIHIEGVSPGEFQLNSLEKIAMWTLAALCHDLGYPLQKSAQVMDATKEMMRYFVANPKFSHEVAFSGVQDLMNEYILRLISSRMVEQAKEVDSAGVVQLHAAPEKRYSGRVQPKYYMKFSKSLENSSHGIISAIIIYKTLLYFMESDYNINEDYFFDHKDAKQFYIRRDILRAIAAHTTADIYHMHATTLGFLLYICDEMQEWDRRSYRDFYKPGSTITHEVVVSSFNSSLTDWEEDIKDFPESDILGLVDYAYNQFQRYQKVFRDGQDTISRTFDFKKSLRVEYAGSTVSINSGIPHNDRSYFRISLHEHVDRDSCKKLEEGLSSRFGKKLIGNDGNERCFAVDPYRIR